MRHATGDTPDTLAAYLSFLDAQMAARPDLATPFTASDIEGLEALLDGVPDGDEVDWEDFELGPVARG